MQSKPPNLEDPWEACYLATEKHTEDYCESLKDEVDKLLIFAGLFSAVVTAFVIESYRFAKEDPAETTVLLLRSISLQLGNITHLQSNVPIDFSAPSPDISASARRINALWFLSLTFSLSTTVAGIMYLQWIREYTRKTNVSSRDDIALRNLRREGMERWQVFRFLHSLPLLLLAALLLFFAGLIEFLRQVDGVVTILVSVVVGMVFLFVLATSLLPGLEYLYLSVFPGTKISQCPYKSPQSLLYYNAATFLLSLFTRTKTRPSEPLTKPSGVFTKSWSDYDHFLRSRRHDTLDLPDLDIGRGLAWVGESFVQNQKLVEAVSRCLQDLDPGIALDGVLARVNRHRAARVRRTQHRLRAAELDTRSSCSRPPRQKADITQDLVISHTLEHFSEKIEQKYMSLSLLQRRLDLFLKVNEREDIDSDLDCPINHHNVALIERDTRERVLWCINALLQRNMNCNDTHLNAAFEIIKSIFTENHDPDTVPPVVSDMFTALLGWVERDPINPFAGKPPEKRLKQAIPFHKLLLVCKGEGERVVVEHFCQALDSHIERVFGREVDTVRDSEKSFTGTVEFDSLARYMTGKGLN